MWLIVLSGSPEDSADLGSLTEPGPYPGENVGVFLISFSSFELLVMVQELRGYLGSAFQGPCLVPSHRKEYLQVFLGGIVRVKQGGGLPAHL